MKLQREIKLYFLNPKIHQNGKNDLMTQVNKPMSKSYQGVFPTLSTHKLCLPTGFVPRSAPFQVPARRSWLTAEKSSSDSHNISTHKLIDAGTSTDYSPGVSQ